jgi:hypothetical protein
MMRCMRSTLPGCKTASSLQRFWKDTLHRTSLPATPLASALFSLVRHPLLFCLLETPTCAPHTCK